MRLWLLLLVAFGLCAESCAPRPANLVQTGERYLPSAGGVEEYRLGPGDKVRVTVFNEETLSGEFSVNADGVLSLPLVGDIKVAGKSASNLVAAYQKALADGYLREPKVSAEIVTYRPFFVLGEVKMPGQFPYASGMTVLNAIALAQGFTPRAQKGVAFIRRAGLTAEEAYKITPDLRIMPGDTLRIGERYF